jgi:acetyl esterase
MPLDPRVQRFLTILAAGNPPSVLEASVVQRRQALAELMKLSGAEIPVGRIEDRTIPGPGGVLRVRIYSPLAAADARLPGLVYFHGGGLVAGSIDTHDAIARALANAAECRVVSVDYRLAPEHPFPAAVVDALAAVRHVGAMANDFGIDVARLGVCGDSAGGTLAAACCQALARDGGPSLALQVLLCPILDYSRLTPSRQEYGAGYLVDQATLDHDLLHYLPPGTAAGDPRISPLRAADLGGLPPTLIHTAEFDPLRDEGRDYGERVRAAGSPASYYCHPGMIHLFYGLGGVIPYAQTAMQRIGAEIRTAFSGAAQVSRPCWQPV